MIFTDNKYLQWYNTIITNAQQQGRKKLKKNQAGYVYYEKHHIIPTALGGLDVKDNWVNLTAREHFICHWLLIKFTAGENRSKMICALHIMSGKNNRQDRYESKITSKVYEKIREEYSQIQRLKKKGKATGRTPWNKGKKIGPHSVEQKFELSKSLKGRFTGDKNSGAKTYELIDPVGTVYIVTGKLKSFCTTHALRYNSLIEMVKGKRQFYNGWTIKYA